jgi:hypothetical protein
MKPVNSGNAGVVDVPGEVPAAGSPGNIRDFHQFPDQAELLIEY